MNSVPGATQSRRLFPGTRRLWTCHSTWSLSDGMQTSKKKGARLPDDHYRDRKENSQGGFHKMHLEEVQIARQGWEFLVQEAESAGEGELRQILLNKLAPETKMKIWDNQVDKKVNGH